MDPVLGTILVLEGCCYFGKGVNYWSCKKILRKNPEKAKTLRKALLYPTPFDLAKLGEFISKAGKKRKELEKLNTSKESEEIIFTEYVSNL